LSTGFSISGAIAFSIIGAIAFPVDLIFMSVDLHSISGEVQIRRRRFSWFNIGGVVDYIFENFFLF
jgi:hypothetical protein